MKQAQRIDRALEEIANCNTAVRRLHTQVLDEDTDLKKLTCTLTDQANPIAGAVQEYMTRRIGANMHVLSCIQRIHQIDGYTGSLTPGIRIGRLSAPIDGTQGGAALAEADDDDDDAVDLQDEGEDVQEEYHQLFNYVSDMPLQTN